MKVLVFETVEEALARSQAGWEAVIGRPVTDGDVTLYLWPCITADGRPALAVEPDDERLTPDERERLEDFTPSEA